MTSLNEGRETPTITRRRHVLACARCRARRVKCDRAQPACSNCSKAGALCRPAQQLPGPSPTSVSSRSSTRDPHDSARLQKLEETVARLSREADSNSPSREPSTTPSPEEFEDGRARIRGQVLRGPATRYLGPHSWALVSESLADIPTVLGSNPFATSTLQTAENDDQSALMIDEHLHELLLTIFSHRVDPLIRLLHWPSFLQRCQIFRRTYAPPVQQSPNPSYPSSYYPGGTFGASSQDAYSGGNGSVSSESHHSDPSSSTFKALLSSVYYAALVAVIDSPNPPDLGPNINAFSLAATFKKEVSIRVLDCRNAVHDGSLEMLQAIVLYMSVEPLSDDVQILWYQHGVAVRIAQGLGVHRDGANFDFGPIEIETRRRTWAQLCILDVRFAEQLGREPSITQDDYDSILPLSIDDRDLSEIEEQNSASRQGQNVNFKTHQEIEQAQEQLSPFSPMSFSLVQAELARLMSKLLSTKYRARDSMFSGGSASPQLHRRPSSLATSRAERALWISRLEHRFHTVYELSNLDASPKQYLVAELIKISLAKAKFVACIIEWKEADAAMGASQGDPEHSRLVRDATSLASRSLSLLHQYSTSPFSWYTKRLRDVYTSSFLAFSLASGGRPLEQKDISSGWAVLDQLYPVDATGRLIEHGISGSALGKVLLSARARRGLQVQSHAHAMRDQAMHAATGNIHDYSTTVAAHPSVTLPTAAEGATFQSPGNMFEDFDAMMHDPLWPSGLSGMEHPYGAWTPVSTSAPQLQTSLRSQSQLYDQQQNGQHEQKLHLNTKGDMGVIMTRSPVPSLVFNTTSPLPQFDPDPLSNDGLSARIVSSPKMMDTTIRHGALEHTRSWPVLQPEDSPARFHRPSIRERSSSQPQPGQLLEVVTGTHTKKRSNSMNRSPNVRSPAAHVSFPPCGLGLDSRMDNQQLMQGESMQYEMHYA